MFIQITQLQSKTCKEFYTNQIMNRKKGIFLFFCNNQFYKNAYLFSIPNFRFKVVPYIQNNLKVKKILKYSPGNKSLKATFIIDADLECFLKKEQSCQNNAENSYTEKKAKHKPSGYSLSLICSFDDTKHRRKFYRRKDCIDKICEHLKELATEIINYKEKEMIPLTYNKIKSY